MDNADELTSMTTTSKMGQPKPTDFDRFLPWACKEYSIDADVFITRNVQKSYVIAATPKKKLSIKSRRQPPVVLAATGSEDNVQSSLLGKAVNYSTSNENKVNIETFYNSNEDLVQLKLLKNKIIPRKVMQVIALTLPYQKHLTSITINRGLRMDSLYEISKFLPNSSITELCLDSTFLSDANYDTLLTHSKLKHLSLAKCTINDAVVKKIADQLKDPCPASRILSALNLSSNRITDVGAKYLADMLRTNRQLSYLNLAGNIITDEGGMSILDKLHEFPVQAEELSESRAKYVAYLKKRTGLIDTLIMELQNETFNKNQNKKKPLKKGKLESQSLQYLPTQKPLISSDEAQRIHEKAGTLVASRMGLFNDPFSQDNTKSQDGVVHCLGNNTLCYLNIAYNNLTYASLKKLHEVLSTQRSLNRTPRGLIKVVIEGNLMPVACKEYEEIDKLLESSLAGVIKQSEAASKKKATPLSSRSGTK